MGYLGITEPLKSLGTDVPTLVALLVCLIPTTIGALLAAIGIAGMDRALQANIIAKSGKAVETAGDIDTVLLDKTGTITMGNRHATEFLPVGTLLRRRAGAAGGPGLGRRRDPRRQEHRQLLRRRRSRSRELDRRRAAPSSCRSRAQTRMSGIDLPDGTADPQGRAGRGDRVRPGAKGRRIPAELQADWSKRSPPRARRRWWWRRGHRSPASWCSRTS